MSNEKIVPIDRIQHIKHERNAERHLQLVSKCQAAFFGQLPHLIRELFEHADDDMYELANKAQNDIVETQYFSAMRELRKLREDIERTFQTHLKKIFKEFWVTHNLMAADEGGVQLDGLSLVDNDQLEEQLAVDSLVSKAENRYGVELQGLRARFALLANIKELEPKQNPLSPYHFVEAFRIALRQWGGDIGIRLVVFKIFDIHVINYIGGVYDSINEILVDAGVLPKLKRRFKKNPISPIVRKSAPGSTASSAVLPPMQQDFDASSTVTFDLMERMTTWLAQSQNYTPYSRFLPIPEGNEELPAASDSDVLDALTQLQLSILNSPLANGGEIRQTNIGHLSMFAELLRLGQEQAAEKRLGDHDQIVIDTVGMLFDFIVEERDLPESGKALISRLQFPLIKAAKLDFSFFGNKEHPARKLLNTIARSLSGWSDDGDRSNNSLYGQVEAAVSRVLTEFVDDLETFDLANGQLLAFIERQSVFAKKAEERTIQIVRGQEQLLSARRRVADVIHKINLRSENLPDVVIDFEREAWHDVLMLSLLREGEASDRWVEHLATLRLLIWTSTPKSKTNDRQKLMKAIPRLLKRLRAGLNSIGFEMSQAAPLFDRLLLCHRAVLSGDTDAINVTSVKEDGLGVQAEPNPTSPDQKTGDAVLPEVGQWLKWTAGGVSYRGKLAWHSTLTNACIFVNKSGMKLAEMSGQQLSELLSEGNAEVLPEPKKPFMDDVLESMQAVLAGSRKLTTAT